MPNLTQNQWGAPRFRNSISILLIILLTSLFAGCAGTGSSTRGDDEVDAVDAAKKITQNKKKVEALIREVTDTVEVDDEASIRKGLDLYIEAAGLMDESVKLGINSIEPRLMRFEVRSKVANGYTALYAMADAQCTPLEDEGLRPSDELLRKRAEAKTEAQRWLKLARRDMETHLGTSPVQYQTPGQYWALQLIYVQLADFNGARTTLLRLVESHGQRLDPDFRREIDSRVRYFPQKLIDEDG